MTITTMVPRASEIPDAYGVTTAQPVSSLRVGYPAMNSANFLLGRALGRMKCHQRCFGPPTSESATYRVMAYRHPNCDYALLRYKVKYTVGNAATVSFKAGSGDTKTKTFAADTLNNWFSLMAPYGAGDTDDQELLVTLSGQIALASFSIYDVPRNVLTSDEKATHARDVNYPTISIAEGMFLAESDYTGPHSAVKAVIDAWDYYHPQILGWSVNDDISDCVVVTSGTYTDIFKGHPIKHRARQKRASVTATDTLWHIYAWAATGGKYKLIITPSVGGVAVESAELNNTTPGWQQIKGVACANDQDDSFLIQAKTTNASAVYLCAVSGRES